jgi:hypothetical protein
MLLGLSVINDTTQHVGLRTLGAELAVPGIGIGTLMLPTLGKREQK